MNEIPDSHYRLQGKAADIVRKEFGQGDARYKTARDAISDKVGFPVVSLQVIDEHVTAFCVAATREEMKGIKGLKLFRNDEGTLGLRPFGTSKEAREWRKLLEKNPVLSDRRNEFQMELVEHVFGITDGNPWFLRAANGKTYVCSISTAIFNDVCYVSIPTQIEKPKLVDAEMIPDWEMAKAEEEARERNFRAQLDAVTESLSLEPNEFSAMVRKVIATIPLVGTPVNIDIGVLLRWRDDGPPPKAICDVFNTQIATHVALLRGKTFAELRVDADRSELALRKALRGTTI